MLMLLLLYTFLDQASLNSVIEPLTFSFPSFDPSSCTNGSLICMGSVISGNGYLSPTPEPNNNSTLSGSALEQVVRVLFHHPVVAWPASISTTSTVRISPFPNSTVSGDGMAFIIAQDNRSSPPSSIGSYHGIMDPSTQGGVVQQLAVELDTYKNEWDPDSNHIGIDTVSIISPVAAKSFNTTGIDLKSGRKIKTWFQLPSSVFIGFPAATGKVPESHQKKETVKQKVDIEIRTRTAANVPKMFTHKLLAKATHNFNKENLLGTGGFGSVYKGTLQDHPTTVAVKNFSATSKQGEKEYFAEICIIGKRSLDWETRFKILTGLASALLYLHEDGGNPVVHRDVKPNNVMLDEDFNAHLGDFGLTRLLQNDASVTTMLAGTPGYLAPEVGFTGKPTPESDVYCFECVDRRLEGKFDEDQVKRTLTVGLACLHPDSTQRPKIRKVVQIFLNSDEPLMDLPESRPSAVYVSVPSSASTSTNIGSKSASELALSRVITRISSSAR
ncbi:hypothetical protein REPUB_Repub18cG0159000 [Reevesia pubescens]